MAPRRCTPPALAAAATAALLAACAPAPAAARNVTISNSLPRLDTSGAIIDCHSGMILAVNGTFFMYGEHYGNSTGFGPSPPAIWPKIVVYTSPDMSAWTYQGEALADWPTKPYGTFFTPWATLNKATGQVVLWFNAYLAGCCNGNFGVATSADGIHFTVVSLNTTGGYAVEDCNSLFVDDDGTAYVAATSEAEDHRVSIDVLDGAYTGMAGKNLGLFPDHYVEGSMLFRRGDKVYVAYGSCCCFCRGGSGWVVYSAPGVAGPWTRQPLDLNCRRTDSGDVCGAYGERTGDPLIIQAQGIGLSEIPLADGTTALLWHGERWLSAANNNPSCPDECQPESGNCAEPADYIKGQGFSYWIPLQFDAEGNILPFADFVDSFTLDVADSFGVEHLPPRAGRAVPAGSTAAALVARGDVLLAGAPDAAGVGVGVDVDVATAA